MSLRRSIWISTSTITAAAIPPFSFAPITSTMKAGRWRALGLTCTPSAATRILWPPADGCTVMSKIPSLPISIMRTCPMSSIRKAASMRPRSSAFSSTLTSMMTSRRPSGRFWMSRATAMRISRISASVTAADGIARRSSPNTSPMSSACSTMFPRASPAFLTSRLLPASCSCQTLTWAMAVTCSAPAEP